MICLQQFYIIELCASHIDYLYIDLLYGIMQHMLYVYGLMTLGKNWTLQGAGSLCEEVGREIFTHSTFSNYGVNSYCNI